MSEQQPGEQERLLQDLRRRIDHVDGELLRLVNERAGCALEVARVKQQFAGDEPPVFYRPEREAQVLRGIAARNSGPLPDDQVVLLFRQLMSACLALEQPLTVCFLGPQATFTQMAAFRHFGNAIKDKPMSTVDDVFREVESGAADYGVVPVENSTEGVVNHTLDNFLESSLQICGEVALRIHHHLMAQAATPQSDIRRIYSHQQTLAQCRRWLDTHWPKVPRIAVTSNAEAARLVAQEADAAAIAGAMAAEHYALQVLAGKIEDRSDNTTRFLIIGNEQVRPSGSDKTSIMVSTRNRPGALYHLLEPFHRHEISLTSIETRPSHTGRWSYVFFIDFEGHREDETVRRALVEVDAGALEVKVLGSYPRALG